MANWLPTKKNKERERERDAAALAATLSSLHIKSASPSSPPKSAVNGQTQPPASSPSQTNYPVGNGVSISSIAGNNASVNTSPSGSTSTSPSTSTSTSISTNTSNGHGSSYIPSNGHGHSHAHSHAHGHGHGHGHGVSSGSIKGGLLLIRVVEARGLTLPSNSNNPFTPENQQNGVSTSTRESRKWWLPYAVLEFDKNEVLIDALSGELSNPVWQYRAHFDVSRETEVQLSLYIRIPVPSTSSSDSKSNDIKSNHILNQDIFLGHVKLDPRWDEQMQDEWFPLQGGSGRVRVQLAYRRGGANAPLSIDSFDLLKVIGKGSFGKVMQVRKRDTSRIYAMKILRKAHIISRSEVNHTLAERTVLAQINNPFIVPLKFSFQSPEKLYLVLAFVNGGELFHHLQREGRFSEERSRFYAAELLCALECLHKFNVVYRDLKPENILLDYTGHIALCDFGLCKLGMTESETTNTFCGTPEYLAPELLLGKGYTKTVDWWTLGVLLFEMLTGLPPFYDENIHEMYRKILQDELRFPEEISPTARSLLSALLTRDPAQRLGNTGSSAIKQHPFFDPISFTLLMAKKLQPPFKPSVSSATDTSNFDEEFTSEEPLDSVVESSFLSETVQLQFRGFTYNPSQDGLLETSSGNSHGLNGTTIADTEYELFQPLKLCLFSRV
ncbi:AGC protein kinase Gad8 [Modicella reniformis]|uniref:non-specific serine/threonine protein kinase n=1 Tax=Modicella reniformis TaxID=1440133 RepID=A0A9P6SSU9_9FUNG|nr:AGC protein kinase Gad8 [Modicella reniformis]